MELHLERGNRKPDLYRRGSDVVWWSIVDTAGVEHGHPLNTASPSSCRYDDSSITTLDLHSNANITVDNLEFTGKCWAGGAAGAYLGSHGNNNIAENNYFHGWTYASSSTDDSHAMIGGGLSTSAYMLCTRNVFDGPTPRSAQPQAKLRDLPFTTPAAR